MRFQRNLLAGTLTVIPIWITWVVFEFVAEVLIGLGTPWVRALAEQFGASFPALPALLEEPLLHGAIALSLTLIALYLLGWMATQVVGARLLELFDRLVSRIPVVELVYGSARKLVNALNQKPVGTQRVVLIEFPSSSMKTIGLVTRVLKDQKTGAPLAAVYVPTTPNPTSGYLEIVPVERLVELDWTLDEAMSFIISGGAVAPEHIKYSGNGDRLADIDVPEA